MDATSPQPVQEPPPARWRAAAGWLLPLLGLVAVLAGLAHGAARLADSPQALRTLSFVVEPYLRLSQQATAAGGGGDTEFRVFLADDPGEAARAAFFARQPHIRQVRPGALPNTLVVAVSGRVDEAIALMRGQPFVGLMMSNRGVFVCH